MNRGFVLLIGVFMFGSVFGLGVSPARTTLDFEAGMVKEVSFDVANSGSEDMRVVFSAQGDLAEYIVLPVSEGVVSAGEGSKTFSYRLELPDLLDPGLNTGEVVVLQLPSEGSASGSSVLATLAVVTQVYLYVPYPGKYATAKMYVYPDSEGAQFVIPVVSQGEFDLTSVRANVDIYNEMGVKVDSFNIDSIEVPSGEKKELVYDWGDNVSVGSYVAKASVIYDEGTISLEEEFSIGGESLELQEIGVDDFSLGDIAKLEMLVENQWSSAISDVYIETEILNDRGGVVSSLKSSDYDIGAFEKESFVSYWDTEGVLEGTYDVEVSINYGDKSSKKALQFDVREDELVVIGLGYVISADGVDGENVLIIVLIVAIVVLVLINLIWFLVLRKRLKGRK